MMDDVDDDAITLPLIPESAPLSYVDSWDAFWTEFDAREAAKTQGPLPVLVVDELEANVRRKGTAAFEAQPRSELVDPAFGTHPSLVAYATTKPFLTTREATAYCGFKTASALRKAKLEGRIAPAGRRGGLGTWMWARESLDCFLRGALARRAPGRVPATERSGAPPFGGSHGEAEDVEVVQGFVDLNAADSAAGLGSGRDDPFHLTMRWLGSPPGRSGRAEFPHPAPRVMGSLRAPLKSRCGQRVLLEQPVHRRPGESSAL